MNNTLFEYIAVMNVVRSAIVTIFAYFLLSISVYSALFYCISEKNNYIKNNSIIGAFLVRHCQKNFLFFVQTGLIIMKYLQVRRNSRQKEGKHKIIGGREQIQIQPVSTPK